MSRLPSMVSGDFERQLNPPGWENHSLHDFGSVFWTSAMWTSVIKSSQVKSSQAKKNAEGLRFYDITVC